MSTCGGLMDFLPANFMLQVPNNNDQQFPSSLASVLPTCTPQDFHAGFAPMVGKRLMPHAGIDVFQEEANGGGGSGSGEEDNLSDDGSQAGEKKRRLNMEQVKTLERNFELGNKLDPERKMQLAKALGLQPRQIAIWFQNRRARWKTKQLEKDYVILQRQFKSLKAENESLLAQNHKLQSEISTLKGREPTESINLNKETDQFCSSNKSENSTDIKLDNSTRTTTMKIAIAATERSPFSSHPTRTTAFFPPPPSSSYTINQTNGPTTPLIQNPPDLHCQKFDQGFTNMFSGIDYQSGFWPLLEQHNYN